MIERHVYVKLKDEHATDEARSQAVERTRELASIPGVLSVSVGTPADLSSLAAWDFCIRLEFESIEAVEAYRVHPDHQRYLDEFLAPRADVRKAWNFEV